MSDIKKLTIGQDELDLSKYSHNTKIDNSTSSIIYKKITINTVSGQASDGVLIFGRDQFYLLNLMYASGYMGALHEIGTKANNLTPTNSSRYIHLKVHGTANQHETIIYAAIENYSFISMFSTAEVVVEDSTKEEFDSASTNVIYRYIPDEGEIKVKYTNANLKPADDTTASWRTLFNNTPGVYFTNYSESNCFTNQPNRYGFLRTIIQSNEVNQMFTTQPDGVIYSRAGNGTGWNNSATDTGAFTPVIASLTKNSGGNLGQVTAGNDSQSYLEVTKITTATNINDIKTTGLYIVAVSGCTGTPTTGWGTLYTDWSTGTKYQLYIIDGNTAAVYKRGWNSSSSTWQSWTRIAYPVDSALSETSINPVQNKAITNKLKDFISNKTEKVCGVGSEIELENTSNSSLIVNRIEGDSHQEELTGKNLYKTSPTNTSNGIAFYLNENGTYDIAGTATAEANHIVYEEDITKFEDGATYTLSATKPLEYGTLILLEGYNGTTWVRHALNNSRLDYTRQVLTGTLDLSGCTRLRFVIRIQNKCSINTFGLGIQLEKNSTETSFEKYNDGQASGTPSPTNPVKIDNITGTQIISVDGENLFDKNNYTPGYWWNNNGVISGGDTNIKGIVFECKPNTEYCVIKSNSGTNNRLSAFTTHDYPALGVSVLNHVGIAGAENNDTSVNILTPSNAKYLVLYLGSSATTPTIDVMVEDLVIKEVQNYTLDLISGNNIIDVNKLTGEISGITHSVDEDGTINLSGTVTAGGTLRIPLRFPQSSLGKIFTFTSTGTFDGITNYGIKNFNQTQISSDLIFTDAASKSFIVNQTLINNAGFFVIYCNANEVVDASFKVRLIQNNIPEEYELYEPLKLRSIGTKRDALYRDGTWRKDKYVEYAKFDGTETAWEQNIVSGQAEGIRYFIPIDNGDTSTYRTNVVCNRGIVNTGQVHNVGVCFIYQSKFYFYPEQTLDTVDKFKEWLTSNNIEIIYPAKTKVTEEITNPLLIDELDKLEEIHGIKENTRISISASNLPAILDVCQNSNEFTPASNNRLGSVIVGNGLKIDNGGTLSTDDARINQIERYYRSLVPVGTTIQENDDLNTVEFLTVGKYKCGRDTTVATLSNCPTTRAFMMEVFSVLSEKIDDEFSTTYCYRVRMITDYYGNIYIQRCSTSGTPGVWTYQAWQKIQSKSDVDSAINSAVMSKYGRVQCTGSWPADKPWVKIAQMSHNNSSNDNVVYRFKLDYLTSSTTSYIQSFTFGIGMRCTNTSLQTNHFDLLDIEKFNVTTVADVLDFFSNVKVTYRWTAGSSGVNHKMEYQIWVQPRGSWRMFWLRPQPESYKNDYGISTAFTNSTNEWTYYNKTGAPSSIGSETYIESGFTELECKDSRQGSSYLENYFTSRQTTPDIAPNGLGGLFTFKSTSSMTQKKPFSSDGHIVHFNWDNANGYDSQLFVGQGGNPKLGIRAQNGGTWGNWIEYAKASDVEILDIVEETDWENLWQ